MSPNGKIPAIVDHDVGGLRLMESGAILLYFAEKTGRLLPSEPEQRWRAIEWLMWQMGGIGPMLGQHPHFTKYNPDASAYARERYAKEAGRLYAVRRAQHGRRSRVPGTARPQVLSEGSMTVGQLLAQDGV